MNPQTAIAALLEHTWNLSQIGRHVGIHKANIRRIYLGWQEPTWSNGQKIIELAHLVSGEKGRK